MMIHGLTADTLIIQIYKGLICIFKYHLLTITDIICTLFTLCNYINIINNNISLKSTVNLILYKLYNSLRIY